MRSVKFIAVILPALLYLLAAVAVRAETYAMPKEGNDLIGKLDYVKARQTDTLLDIGRDYGLGYEEIRLANASVDTWMPGEGARVTIPSFFVLPNNPRKGIVVNLAEMRVYYYAPAKGSEPPRVITYPASVGRMDWKSPLGVTRIERKIENPAWYPPDTIKREHAAQGDMLPDVVPAGPDNPLGQHAMYLGLGDYLLHGTNRPFGIGMRVTHGCIRLYPEDIKALFQEVAVGTPVTLVDQPYKVGWLDGQLYLEAHPFFGEQELGTVTNFAPLNQAVLAATASRPDYPIYWAKAREAAVKPTGIPVAIGPPRPTIATR